MVHDTCAPPWDNTSSLVCERDHTLLDDTSFTVCERDHTLLDDTFFTVCERDHTASQQSMLAMMPLGAITPQEITHCKGRCAHQSKVRPSEQNYNIVDLQPPKSYTLNPELLTTLRDSELKTPSLEPLKCLHHLCKSRVIRDEQGESHSFGTLLRDIQSPV